MKRKQWKKLDIVERERERELHFSKLGVERDKKRGILDKSNSTGEVNIKAKKKTIAIVGVIVILALIIFVAISQRKTIQEMIIKAQEQMQSSEEVSNPVVRATGVTSVDITGLVTGDDVNHTHIYEAKHDENYHWEECWICGDIQNKEAHSFQENWTLGDSCSPQNILIHSCACGYNYSTPNTRPHTPNSTYSWNRAYHVMTCAVCRAELTASEPHRDANGIAINCTHGGTCSVCGAELLAKHAATIYFNSNDSKSAETCFSCGKKFIDVDNSNISVTYDENNNFSYIAKVMVDSSINIQQIEVNMNEGAFYSRADITSKNYSVSGREITLTSTGRFHDDVEVEDSFGTVINITDTTGQLYEFNVAVHLLPDREEPNIISATVEGNGTVDNYTQKATITVNATENWCSTAYMALYSTQGVCLRDYVAANSLGNGNFQGTIDVVGEYREPQDLIVKVKDYLGNETEVPVTVQYIDAKAPDLTNEEDYTSEWSKTKEVTFNAQDLGVGKVQIAFNNVNDYQEANGEGDNYTRTYNFYGDVYDKVTAAIYLKDGLGNEQVVRVDIGKLDGTAPTITKAELQNKTIVLEANDMHETLGEGSGVAGYRYVASLEDNGTVITENSGTYITENQIDISNMSKVKYVYIAPVDEVGNIGETVKVELPTYSYTVNYYEEGTVTKVAESKVVGDKAIGEEIEETAINITGYNAVAPITQRIEIQESGNEINFYYTKRNDLTYTVQYLEQGTNKELHTTKTENNRTYKETIRETAIDIAGYNAIEPTTQSIEIGVGTNEIIFYYSKRTDIEYRVEYYYDEKIDESKTERYTGTYEEVITEYEDKITEKYELEKVENLPLTIGANEEENVIKVWYVRKDARVVVHHYIEGTEEQVPSKNGGVVEDEIIEGKVDDEYSTEEAKDIPANYKCVGNSNNTSGNMTIEKIEVIYYYGLKEAQIENNIEMTGTEKIIEEDEEVEYRISSNVEVNTYIGDMTVTIVVTLPYEIDEEKSELNGGIYNSGEKTITWTERIEGVDTFTEGIEEIQREKNITVVYENIDYSKISFEAKVETKVELETPKQEDTTEPVIVVTETEFTKEVKVTKIWNHTNNIYKIPSEVKVQVKNGTVVEEEKVINSSNKVNDDENTWTWTFTNLPKYNSEGKEIEYTVDEEEVTEGDLVNYRKEIEYVENTTDEDKEEVIIRNTYNGAVISANKEMTTANGLNYVVEGEKITYTIKVQNNGDLGQDIVIKDSIPEGTKFVEGSIKVNGVVDTSKTATDLTNGIRVNVPAREDENNPGEATVSFEVIVENVGKEGSRTIRNTARINKDPDNPESEEEETNGTEMPVLIYNKAVEIIKNEGMDGAENNNINEGEVTAGDRIKYTITINNVGEEAIRNVEIKDTVPEGTTIYQINDEGEIGLNDTNEIEWEISEIGAGETKEVSFEVTVNYAKEGKTIRNVATVDGKETNEVEITYEVPEIDLESSIVKDGTERITSTEEKISYTINYRVEIGEFVGKGKLKIVDYLPYEIDEENSELNGGTYNKESKTITWEEDLGNVDTYGESDGVKEIERSKSITIKYKYPDEENLSGTIENRAEGTITLTQEKEIENPENPDEPIIEEVVVKEETKEDNQEVKVEIPTKVIVHHYIYDEEAGGETEEQVPSKTGGKVGDEEKEGIVGDSYTTSPSNEVNENYQCVNRTPENYAGTMTKTEKEVTYYYQLKTAEVGGEIEKTAEASKEEEREYETGEVDGEGNPILEKRTVQILTEEDGVVTYKIKYRAGIKEYKGKATITIVDKLPAEIDVEDTRVELDGGTYNREEKTITWVDEVEVDTFATGEMYDETFEKEIKIVYKDQNVVETLINTVEGRVEIYYPEGHSTKPGGERETNTVRDTAEVEQEYRVAKEVEKVWEDNNDVKGNRPESVTVQLTANGSTNYGGQELEKVVLNETNNWKYTFKNLEKYNEIGQEIEYSVEETETNPGDLEYYDTPMVTKTKINDTTEGTTANERITVTNKYKLMNTEMESSIEKIGTEKVTESKEEVSYRITYKATITDYIGEAVVKIVDTLPYKLAKDENENLIEGIELAGGTYEEGTQTITWEERIEHINTYTNGEYEVNIEKEIKVVYEDLDATQRSMRNEVKGTIDLYETEQTNTVEDRVDTIVEVPGKVIVKYIDRETGKEITYIEQGEEAVEKTYGYEINGLAGEEYTTEEKIIPGYTYVENSGNAEGNMVEGTIEVIYYYERTISGGVEVRYIDEETGEEIAESETIEGRVGDTYKTEQKEIYGYEYVREEGETEGKLTEEGKEVVYIYKKIPGKVIIRYLEKDETEEDDSDNKVLRMEEVIEGYVGDRYTTERQEIENYRAAEPEPSNKEGEMTQEDIYVTYYYEKIPSGILTVKYVDVETREEILYKVGDEEEGTGEYKTYREEKQGYVGEKYKTEQKEIPYYKIVEELIPANREGRYTEENVEVTYYYQKQIFDMSIDKNVERIEINGEEQEVIDGKINKVEVVGSKVKETEVKITYSIEVRNEGEIEGTGRIVENIPEDFEVNEETGEEWKETEEGKLEAEVELKAGETKELKVVLNWKNGENNFGVQKNTAEIVETSNPASYEEANEEDNSSSSEVVMGVKTGDVTRSVIFIIATIGMIISLLVFIYVADKYVKEMKM